MKRFPKRKVDIIELANQMIGGFDENPSEFPPQISDNVELKNKLATVEQKLADRQELKAHLKAAILEKQASFAELKQTMRKLLDLAEGMYLKTHPKILGKLGWEKRFSRENLPPAQPRNLAAERLSPGEVKLTWKQGR